MSTTKNISGTELKEKLLSGIEKLNLAVSSTLGPGGRTVLIREQNGEVKVTKDGVTVAKAFHKLEDDVEDLGAQLVKQVSIKSAIEAGDGTTTATVLAHAIFTEGNRLVETGAHPMDLKKGIEIGTVVELEKNKTISHEKVHIDQMKRGDLDYTDTHVMWKGKQYSRATMDEGSKKLPWEMEAYKNQ